jgi:membrane associated rhomboid family serine protease
MAGFTDQWQVEGGVEERLVPSSPGALLPSLAALSSAGIPHRVEAWDDGQTHILVSSAWAERARLELVTYEEANRDWPRQRGQEALLPVLGIGELACATGVAAALLNFYLRSGPVEESSRLFEVGALDVAQVQGGAWWRTVTSLWLHADLSHVLGNAVAAAAFGAGLTQLIGVGPAWVMVLLSGVLGNLSEALISEPGRSAIGASTATFGALGALGVLQTVRAWRRCRDLRVIFSRTWVPLAAAGALLGWLGTGSGADIIGHALGFAWGMVLALPCLPLLQRTLPWYVHVLCGLAASGLVAWAWRLALA